MGSDWVAPAGTEGECALVVLSIQSRSGEVSVRLDWVDWVPVIYLGPFTLSVPLECIPFRHNILPLVPANLVRLVAECGRRANESFRD